MTTEPDKAPSVMESERVSGILSGYLPLINQTPLLQSLLYDAGMLPEQTFTVRGAISVAAVCEAWKQAVAQSDLPRKLETATALLREAREHVLCVRDHDVVEKIDDFLSTLTEHD